MKRVLLLCLLLLSCTASLAFAQANPFSATRSLQIKGTSSEHPPLVQGGGDTFVSATPIPALPYNDVGYTCNLTDDYSPSCAYSVAPDAVYSFTPAANMCVNISLCGSGYDTVLGVYQNNPATLIACDDDSPACGLQSELTSVPLSAGNTYYIVVDGYSAACGDYMLSVSQCPPPPVCLPCPAGAIAEGEPVCNAAYVDNYNGGCNSTPPVFTHLACAPTQTICGTYGTWNSNGTRDTDWYEIAVTVPTTLTATITGAGLTGSALAIIDNNCAPNVLCGQFTPSVQCATVTCSAPVAPGIYRIFVASFFDNTPCGSNYTLTVSGLDCPTPVQARTWGTLKARYR